jgi:hypothetical protein
MLLLDKKARRLSLSCDRCHRSFPDPIGHDLEAARAELVAAGWYAKAVSGRADAMWCPDPCNPLRQPRPMSEGLTTAHTMPLRKDWGRGG